MASELDSTASDPESSFSSFETDHSSLKLIENFKRLMSRTGHQYPSYNINMRCHSCHHDIMCGIIRSDEALDVSIEVLIMQKIENMKTQHYNENPQCRKGKGRKDCMPVDLPDCLIISFPESSSKYLDCTIALKCKQYEKVVVIGTNKKKRKLLIREKKSKPMFVIYERVGLPQPNMANFVAANCNKLLNTEGCYSTTDSSTTSENGWSLNRDNYPRLTGGGRKVVSKHSYECSFCDPENISSTRGRFYELKNYRIHFKKKHENRFYGPLYSMADFETSVKRNEPKWECKKCNSMMSLGNKTRHEAVCKNKSEGYIYSGESPFSDNSRTSKEKKHKNIKTETKKIKINKKNKNKQLDSDSDVDCVSQSYVESCQGTSDIKADAKNKVKDALWVIEDGNNNINKWWLSLPKDQYKDKNIVGLTIFTESDTDNFIDKVERRFREYKELRMTKDEEIKKQESPEAKEFLFSETRDRPILDKYIKYVRSFSTKDVLCEFSELFKEGSIPTPVQSSTAEQYSKRIMELFYFLSENENFPNFHFDWMTDFNCQLKKVTLTGETTQAIFIPSKPLLQEFLNRFKYGSNPAANYGLRMFALKKFLDFIIQEAKDNEYVFKGDISDQGEALANVTSRIERVRDSVCPKGIINTISRASNKNHKRNLIEQVAKMPQRNVKNIMDRIKEYLESDECFHEKAKFMELCKKTTTTTPKEYMNATNWLLEMIICIGGNRPCAILGITNRDLVESKPGYCPFFPEDDTETFIDEEGRNVIQNPYVTKEKNKEPTGLIINSETDKVVSDNPCFIWLPNELALLVRMHACIAKKILPPQIDRLHPSSRLFLNSHGNPIKEIRCSHFKKYLGFPISAYDFRRSLATFCLDSNNDLIKSTYCGVLRHKKTTGYGYYYPKERHGEIVEYVSVQYAAKKNLLKPSSKTLDTIEENIFNTLLKETESEEWVINQQRVDRALEAQETVEETRRKKVVAAKQKKGKTWILQNEFDNFCSGIEMAIQQEEERVKNRNLPGPFSYLLKYRPGVKDGGCFPPTTVFKVHMLRVLFGLDGEKGEAMRKAEMSVYHGVPFSEMSGRKFIAFEKEKSQFGKGVTPLEEKDDEWYVAFYWHQKLKAESRTRYEGKWRQLRFIFNDAELQYYKSKQFKIKLKRETDEDDMQGKVVKTIRSRGKAVQIYGEDMVSLTTVNSYCTDAIIDGGLLLIDKQLNRNPDMNSDDVNIYTSQVCRVIMALDNSLVKDGKFLTVIPSNAALKTYDERQLCIRGGTTSDPCGHFTLVSNLHCEPNECNIYETIEARRSPKSILNEYGKSLLKTLTRCQNSSLKVHVINVCDQTETECGPIAIALAAALCFHSSEEGAVHYKISNPRAGLARSFEEEELMEFDMQKRVETKKVLFSIDI